MELQTEKESRDTELLNDYLTKSSDFSTLLAHLYSIDVLTATKAAVLVIRDNGKTELAKLLKIVLPSAITSSKAFKSGVVSLQSYSEKMLKASEDFKNSAITLNELIEATKSGKCIITIEPISQNTDINP
jgi:hypothetical protein